MSESPAPALVWCPFPDAAEAGRVTDTLLDEGLIACANIIPGMHTRYVWKGTRATGEEAGALFKTNADLLETLVLRLGQLHPYDEPAILGWRCDAASTGTAAWLGGIGA